MAVHIELELLNVDRLDRLTAIVERARRTMGVPAARELWPMLGLPDLRTSESPQSERKSTSTFDFEGAIVRTVMINGEPWFVGRDVAERLGYLDPTNAMKQHCRGVVKHHPIIDNLGRVQDVRILSEPDVLRLIIKSSLPAAERFERWVFEVVLPEIRRTGKFAKWTDGVRGPPELRASFKPQVDKARPMPAKVWVRRFLDECCETDAKSEVRSIVFREAYRRWAFAEKAPVPLPASLGRYVVNLGVHRRKSCGGGIYVGLRLKMPPTEIQQVEGRR